MKTQRGTLRRISRRDVLKGFGLAPVLLRPSSLLGAHLWSLPEAKSARSAFSLVEERLVPHYPTRSPLEDVLRLVTPGLDEYGTERYAAEIAQILQRWSEILMRGELRALAASLASALQASALTPTSERKLRTGNGITCVKHGFAQPVSQTPEQFLHEVQTWVGLHTAIESAQFEVVALNETAAAPLSLATRVRYSIVARVGQRREQWVGTWHLDWQQRDLAGEAPGWRVLRWTAETESRSALGGPGFADVTEAALGSVPSYGAQILKGADHWRSVLDGACGIDVYGNNGVTAGDFDNDGRDDLYICQAAGLPNRLYRNCGDGTFEDVTDRAGVGVLDNTACALFADFRNKGLQDLLVVCGSGPLLFLNQGDGTFQRKPDAFRFAQPPQGTFTHAAIADYDRDGRLDIYFCLYSYYLGLDQYHYPAPYFDARSGPPNFLLHNEGDGTFVDRTEAAGLRVENDRYSFACAWSESVSKNAPDLYVVNDFGRNNLYRNNGNGTFTEVSKAAHVEDVGAGMSASSVDYNNDGNPDLYVANMWSAAGQRVSKTKAFHPEATSAVRDLYRRHARGNALYRNRGDGSFENVSEAAGVEVGRWAWCSDAWDFDHDGYADLYVTNGYITGPGQRQVSPPGQAKPEAAAVPATATPDLGSFFWRQVVGKSPDDATPSLAYEHGWNALNELIRSDGTWSGSERNVMLANNRDGTFSEVSGAVGLDFLEDGRSFALTDLDGDGRLEIVLKNRNAPQLRILRNAMENLGASVAFRLVGTKSNRDAIGTAITVTAGDLKQTKYLQAGSGFLAQHTKEMHFGLGHTTGAVRAEVRWPSGLTQHFDDLPRGNRIHLREGETPFKATAFSSSAEVFLRSTPSSIAAAAAPPLETETWLIDPLKAPAFSLPDIAGRLQQLDSLRGASTLLCFWTSSSPACREQLRSLAQHRADLGAKQIKLVLLNADGKGDLGALKTFLQGEKIDFPVLVATEEVLGIYNIIYRYLFDHRRDLGLPTSFLLDPMGMIVKVYGGSVSAHQLLEDVQAVPSTPAERVRKALPFAGTLYGGEFKRNDFTYGIAMFQHGYLDQAAKSFEQVIAARPDDAEGYYNLGTLNLRRNNFPLAQQYLQQALKLRPNYPEAWNNLGMIAAQQGRAEEAIQNFHESLQLRPEYSTALLNLGNVYRRQKAFGDAEDSLAKALRLQPDDPEVNYSLGMLNAQQDKEAPAAQYLGRAIELRPDYPEALNNLGVLYVREANYASAEGLFRTCVRLVPGFAQSYLNLARLYVFRHDKTKARTALDELLRLYPDNDTGKQALAALDAMP